MQGRTLLRNIHLAITCLALPLTGASREITRIDAIQGDSLASPMDGRIVTIEGIVVGDFQGVHPVNKADLINGFFVQEEAADEDGNPATSSGIYVYLNDRADIANPVSVGDLVRVTGKVVEFHELTEITEVQAVEVLDIEQPLPPAARLAFPLPMGQSYLERYEGMRVFIEDRLFATEVFQLGRGSKVVLAAEAPQMQPTQLALPGEAARLLQARNDAMRIILDDGSHQQDPQPVLFAREGRPLGPDNTLRWGDYVNGIEGVLTYSFGGYRSDPNAYRVLVAGPVGFTPGNPRPTKPDLPDGDLRVATCNVLNFFNGPEFPTPRGARSKDLLIRQMDKIIHAMAIMEADLIGLNEIENDGFGEDAAISQLATALNQIMDQHAYAPVDPGLRQIGTDEISVGFLYRTDRLRLIQTATLNSIQERNRVPLLAIFEVISTGQRFAAVVNHFKSKSSPALLPGDEDLGDGQGNSNATRRRAAEQVVDWVASETARAGVSNVLILGDLNAYAMEDPVRFIKDAGYTDLASAFADGNPVYSYVFNGQAGKLDYIFANDAFMKSAKAAAVWHINAAEPSVLDYRSSERTPVYYVPGPYRSSDHDPVIAVFEWPKE